MTLVQLIKRQIITFPRKKEPFFSYLFLLFRQNENMPERELI